MLNSLRNCLKIETLQKNRIAMKTNRNTEPVVITKTSKKLESLLGQLKEQKLAQQTKLREMKECTFMLQENGFEGWRISSGR